MNANTNVIKITTYYPELEPDNIRPCGNNEIFYTCNCGESIFKPVVRKLREKDYGKTENCPKCKNLIYTIGRKTVWHTYESGKLNEPNAGSDDEENGV